MALPRIIVRDREIVLLSGFDEKSERSSADRRFQPADVRIHAKDELIRSASRNRDAVAFGYVAGRWFAAA